MKKGLIASFMVALILITVLSTNPSATFISINNENNKDKEISNNNTCRFGAFAVEYGHYPYVNETIPFVWITIRVEGEEENRVQNTLFGSGAFFDVPNNNITVINAENWKYEYADSYYWSWNPMVGDALVIEMVPKYTRTIDYPFLQNFPSLNLLIHRLRI
jgi:hypothetical protein